MEQVIEGVVFTPLLVIENEKGDILRGLKSSESSFSTFGEAYFSKITFGAIKGWKKHNKMTLNLIVPIGAVKFVLFDDREASPSYKKFMEITISADNYGRLSVPSGLWMAFQGGGQAENMLLNIASIEHDPLESETRSLDEIAYDWN